MAKQERAKPENPLLGKNIPPAPPATAPVVGSDQLAEKRELDNGKTVESDNSRMAKGQSGFTVEEQSGFTVEEEKATIELSLYLRPSQDDKLEELRRAYKRQTRKKISANEVMRRLIEHAKLEDIL